MVDQMDQWIHSGQGFIDLLDLADPDHPKGTHPIITHVHVFVNLHKKKKVENDLILQLHVRLWLYTILLLDGVLMNLKVTCPGWKKQLTKTGYFFLDISKKETTILNKCTYLQWDRKC